MGCQETPWKKGKSIKVPARRVKRHRVLLKERSGQKPPQNQHHHLFTNPQHVQTHSCLKTGYCLVFLFHANKTNSCVKANFLKERGSVCGFTCVQKQKIRPRLMSAVSGWWKRVLKRLQCQSWRSVSILQDRCLTSVWSHLTHQHNIISWHFYFLLKVKVHLDIKILRCLWTSHFFR